MVTSSQFSVYIFPLYTTPNAPINQLINGFPSLGGLLQFDWNFNLRFLYANHTCLRKHTNKIRRDFSVCYSTICIYHTVSMSLQQGVKYWFSILTILFLNNLRNILLRSLHNCILCATMLITTVSTILSTRIISVSFTLHFTCMFMYDIIFRL